MARNIISEDELVQLRNIPISRRVDCMALYLLGSGGYYYNMQEVGAKIFGDVNYSYTVSLIHRCYNFSGQNSGRYCNGCKFEQTYGYRVSRNDIEAFVKTYPNGTFSNGITFEEFLIARAESARKARASQMQGMPQIQPQQYNYQNVNYQNTNYQNMNYSNQSRPIEDKGVMLFMYICGVIGIIILCIMLFTGNLFKHWVISLIIAFLVWSIFTANK